MVYLVTNDSRLFESDAYKVISIEESLELLLPLEEIAIDTETTGIEVHTNSLLLAQLGNEEFQVVIDCTTIDIGKYKELFTLDKLWLFWNAKFDLQFFLKHGITFSNIWDGFLGEKLLYLGYPAGQHSMSLKSAGLNYCSVDLDKSIRDKLIRTKTLSEDTIIYGAEDVKYLPEIKRKQGELLKQNDLLTAHAHENKFCIVLAYTEFCGAKLDVEKWKAKMKKDNEEHSKALNALNQWVVDNYPDSEFVYRDYQGNLFSGYDISPKCAINWASPKQVIPLLEKIGFDLWTFDKKTKTKKKSVNADIITPQIDLSPIAPLYINYKEWDKVVTTYGQNVLNQINPVTKRLHTNFNQLGTHTGRLSSGGKDRENGIEYLNFQNFPRDKESRACFVAATGFKWISCDYSAQESRIIAELSQDKSMLDLYNHGSGDIHSLVAKMAYPDLVGDCPVEEIKHRFPEVRQEAKGVGFAISYGGDANTIKTNKNIPLKEAQKIYNDYMAGFPGVAKYQNNQRKFVMKYGYILLNDKTRHKSLIHDFDELKAIQDKFCKEYWDTYNRYKTSRPDSAIVYEVRHYFRRKSKIEKRAINYKCQGTGACLFKLASIYFYKYLVDNNLLFKVKLCIPVHDEWNIEAPEEIADEMATVLEDCMGRAGSYFCKLLPCPATAEIGDHWIH